MEEGTAIFVSERERSGELSLGEFFERRRISGFCGVVEFFFVDLLLILLDRRIDLHVHYELSVRVSPSVALNFDPCGLVPTTERQRSGSSIPFITN